MNDKLWKTITSRRFIAYAAVVALGLFQESLKLTPEMYEKIYNIVIVWGGLETLRSSIDGKGILAVINAILDKPSDPKAAV